MQKLIKTPVIFRKYPDGNVIALFPEKDNFTQPILSYQRNNPPGMVCYSEKIMMTIPARVNEYSELAKELTLQGYNLRVINKRSKR
jgi:hypothetical protein